ncbi:flagellar filament capping protein FliD [Clostridium sp. DL1XJH146]
MSSINFLGSYSGIDQTMVDQLMAAEKMPLVSMSTKVQDYETEKNAWKDINTRMNTLSTKIDELKDEDLYTDKKVSNSSSSVASASVDNDAIEGTYEIEVTKIAKSTTMVGTKVKSPNESLNQSGTLKIDVDGTEKAISVENLDSLNDIVTKINNDSELKALVTASVVDSELVLTSVDATKVATFTDDQSNDIVNAVKNDLNQEGTLSIKVGDNEVETIDITTTDSLSDIVARINEELDNVSATIIDYQLVLKSKGFGDETITLTDDSSDSIIDAIGMKATEQISDENVARRGNNSEFTVNGISVTRSSNEISDVVDGLTFTLKDEGTTTLTVSNDYSDLESAIESFVSQYNSTLSFMQSKSASGDPDVEGSAGDLAGDSSLQRLISNLRTSVSDTISGITTNYKSASSLGITTVDNYGTLSFDTTTFEEAMDDNAEAVKEFFYGNEDDGITGFADKLDTFLEYYTDDSDGIIQSKQTSLESMMDTVNDQIEAFNDRMEAKEAYYIKIFAALDTYMAQAETTTSYLTSQFSSMISSDN